jgi:hypothetical protein
LTREAGERAMWIRVDQIVHACNAMRRGATACDLVQRIREMCETNPIAEIPVFTCPLTHPRDQACDVEDARNAKEQNEPSFQILLADLGLVVN